MKHRWSILFFLWCCLGLRAQDPVSFSVPGGCYEHAFLLELSFPVEGCLIHYTLNGNTPRSTDAVYDGPIQLSEALCSNSEIFRIPLSPKKDDYYPKQVQKSILIRAAAFDAEGNPVSRVTTQSYFIKELGCDSHGLPVVSLCADSIDLFGFETGILVPGIHFDPENPKYSGNYNQTGLDWERCCNVECYRGCACVFNQQAGLRTHGNNARRLNQKGLKLYARKEYGKKRFQHDLFDQTELREFKRLVLKPWCCSWTNSGVEDFICSQMATTLNLEWCASCPVVMYLNGEYWGIYYLLERPDEHYLEDHFDVDSEDCNIVNNWTGTIDCGSNDNFMALKAWLQDADLSDATEYAQLCSLVDVDCFIDYMVLETFIKNRDWPSNNMRCWQEGNGRWRWIFFDGDAALKDGGSNIFDVAIYTGEEIYPSSQKATLLFRKLLENQGFIERFSSRYRFLMHHDLAYTNTYPSWLKIQQALEREIPSQSQRFGTPVFSWQWSFTMSKIRSFLEDRPSEAYAELMRFLSDRTALSSLSCYPNPSQGDFKATFDAETSGLVNIRIYNLSGQCVYTQTVTVDKGPNTIPVKLDLTAGVYVIQINRLCEKIGVMR